MNYGNTFESFSEFIKNNINESTDKATSAFE